MSDLTVDAQDEWVRAPLSRFLTLNVEVVDVEPDQTYPTVGVLNRGRGLLYRDPVAGSSTAYKKLNRIGPGVLVYSRLKAFEGAITVTPDDLPESFASQEFPTFAFASDVDPDFFRILTTTQSMWHALQGASKGMGGRRERVKPADFLNIVMDIPPLPVQERIVEIINVVDEQVAALEDEADSLLAVRNAALGDMLSRGGEGWLAAPLSEAGTLTRGRRFVKSDYVESGLGCIHYGQIYTDYGASASRTVTYLPESFRGSMRKAEPGDVVIAGTSENIEDVGKAVAWLGDDDVAVHDDCFIFRHDLDPKFVSYFFASPLFQHRKRQFTSVTKVVRISAANLKKIVMPVPPREEQERISRIASAVDAQVGALRAEAERLRQARTVLLSRLLNRTIDVKSAELLEV
ncbi:restriction endonuclease subunit S [Streptomyces sp. NPDC005951]|uniref:restriction endonuclease subunit S n=1 Tax=Streptomyces sp. NPDC005951 TaxID=3154573 RepID=UPI0033E9767C